MPHPTIPIFIEKRFSSKLASMSFSILLSWNGDQRQVFLLARFCPFDQHHHESKNSLGFEVAAVTRKPVIAIINGDKCVRWLAFGTLNFCKPCRSRAMRTT